VTKCVADRVYVMLSFFGAACTIGASQQMFLQQGELEFEGHAEAVALQTVIAYVRLSRMGLRTQFVRIV
jgi:hypothetical protein